MLVAFELIDAGDAGVGYLSAALGIGGFVGGFVALVLATRGRLAADFGIGVVLFGVPFAVIGVFASYPVALLAFGVVGIGNSVADIAALTLFQRIVPDHVLGRVLGVLEGILLGAIGLGGLVAPLCIALIGTKPSLLVAGIVLPVATLLVAGRLAAIDRTTVAPVHAALLRGVPLLGVLPEPVLEFLATSAVPTTARAGEAIVREGEVGDRFYVIESGEVEILGGGSAPASRSERSRSCATCPHRHRDGSRRRPVRHARSRPLRPGGHRPRAGARLGEQVVAERLLGSFSPLLG